MVGGNFYDGGIVSSFSTERSKTNRLKLTILALFTLTIPVWLLAQHGGNEGEGRTNSASPQIEEKRSELAASVHKNLSCTTCHGETEHGFEKLNPVTTCADCHEPQMQAFTGSVHAVSVDEEKPNAASCIACHGSHNILAVADSQSPVSRPNVTEATCARCHDAEVLSPVRGVPRNFVADYRRSFHGLSAALGDRRVANCASCHSYHAVLPSGNPRSTVHEKNLVQTCGVCHTQAKATFSTGGVHYNPDTTGFRIVDFVRVMYLMMITLAVSLMFLHNAIDFGGRLRDHFRQRTERKKSAVNEKIQVQPLPSEGDVPIEAESASGSTKTEYLRFTISERIQHWTLAASFIVLALTGFALRYTWQIPFLESQQGALVRGFLHRGAAITFIILSAYHLFYLVFTRRGRDNFRAIVPRLRSVKDLICRCAACFRLGPPTAADWQNLIQTVKYNLGLAATRPPMGRFTYAEKMEYYGLIWGSAVMIVTGLILWFETPFLNRFQYWVFELATTVHYYEAVLATLSILVWHFYFTIYNPRVFPLSRTMITGEISREEMEIDHALELEKVEKEDTIIKTEATPEKQEEKAEEAIR